MQVHSTKCCQANSMAEVPAGPGSSATGESGDETDDVISGGKSFPPRVPQMTFKSLIFFNTSDPR